MHRPRTRILIPFIAAALVASLGLLSDAPAETCTAADCTWVVSGTEPNQRTNGAALDDLKQINIKTTVNGTAQPVIVTPATAPTGGGTFTMSVTLASAACKSTTLVFTASASSLGGLESGDAVPFSERDQQVLAERLRTMKGKWLVTNSDSQAVRQLYRGFPMRILKGQLSVEKSHRRQLRHLAISNYAPPKT